MSGTLDVVAAAILRDGAVLAARRARPAHHAGRWEFPGGKVEAGEDERAALVRECREELDIDVRVGSRLDETTSGELRLVLYEATISAGEARAGDDHDELRWLTAATLDSVDWLPIDAGLLQCVRPRLRDRIRRSTL